MAESPEVTAQEGDAILLEGVLVPCALGVTEAERRMRRPVRIDLELGLSLARSGQSDQLGDTVDYGEVFGVVEAVAGQGEHALVEALAERIVAALFARFGFGWVRIVVRKSAPLAGSVERTGVRIVRYRDADL